MTSFKEFDIKRSYINCGEWNFPKAFLNPLLECTKIYKRSVGFFTSGVFTFVFDGIKSMYINKGKIQLIASPNLQEDDMNAIIEGYNTRENIYCSVAERDFETAINDLSENNLQILKQLIASNTLDIKIAMKHDGGLYHDKLGILEDFNENKIAFFGSANSSKGGYNDNYEKIRVVYSWDEILNESIIDEETEFDNLWNGRNSFLKVWNFNESATRSIIRTYRNKYINNNQNNDVKPDENKESKHLKISTPPLRKYQIDAIQNWVNNNYRGFDVMATGTGKTYTALFSLQELYKHHNPIVVICAPYKHLLKQWEQDINIIFPEADTILVSSENATWPKTLEEKLIIAKHIKKKLIIISTIASFNTERFCNIINKQNQDKLLIVDEAHRFKTNFTEVDNSYKYLLGLSATPGNGNNDHSGKELVNFFGGCTYSLPIEKVLGKYLVNYYYFPTFVTSSESEESKFRSISGQLASCYKNGKCIDEEKVYKLSRQRLRIIAMSENKQNAIESIIQNQVDDKDHFIVYCGDGKLYSETKDDYIKHINIVKGILNRNGYRASQFTAQENMSERMQIIDSFNQGKITALAAIKCLDEGINIPSIKSALILASNDSYREFVQRRGRILRKYEDKKNANIFDIVVLPDEDLPKWAAIELRRYYEYARLAINKEALLNQLDDLLNKYNLSIGDISMFEDNMEEPLDE